MRHKFFLENPCCAPLPDGWQRERLRLLELTFNTDAADNRFHANIGRLETREIHFGPERYC